MPIGLCVSSLGALLPVLLFFPVCVTTERTARYIFSLESRLSHPQGDDAEWGEDTNGSRATKRVDDDDSGGLAYIFSISHCKEHK